MNELMSFLGPKKEKIIGSNPSLDEMKKKFDESSNTRAWISGATPLLVGLLAGHTGSGVEIAGKALLEEDKRKMEEEGSLLSYLRKRNLASSKSSERLYQIRDPQTGDIKYGTASEAYGSLAPRRRRTAEETVGIHSQREQVSKDIVGKGKKLTKDIEGRPTVIDLSEEYGQVFPAGNIPPETRKRAISATKDFETQTQEIRKGIEAAEQFKETIKLGNPISDQLAIFKLAKTADNGGRLSDQDVAYFKGAKGLQYSINQFIENYKTGKLTKENKKFMNELADRMMATSRAQLSSRAMEFSKRRAPLVGIPYRQMLKYVNPSSTPSGRVTLKKKKKSKGLGYDPSKLSEEELDKRIKELQGKK